MALFDIPRLARTYRQRALPSDHVLLLYTFGVFIAVGLGNGRIPRWWLFALGHLAVMLGVLVTAVWGYGATQGVRRFWRNWDVAVFVAALFAMNLRLVHHVNPRDVDALLIRWEQSFGGVAFLQWTMTWATPLTDELSKLVWTTYFLLPFILGGVLYAARRQHDFEEIKLVLILGWISSYTLYFFFPAQGPLHFPELGLVEPSDGVLFGGVLKQVIGSAHGEVARDSFPSGHAMIAFLVMALSVRHRLWKTCLVTVPLGLGIIFSTLTLRYHYVVDVLAGLLLCLPVLWAGIVWYRRWLSTND